jgi:hypothetical protein
MKFGVAQRFQQIDSALYGILSISVLARQAQRRRFPAGLWAQIGAAVRDPDAEPPTRDVLVVRVADRLAPIGHDGTLVATHRKRGPLVAARAYFCRT